MSRNISWLKYKWLCLASGGSLLIGLFHNPFRGEEQKLEASSAFVYQPSGKWDDNWDRRSLSSIIKPSKRGSKDPEEERRRLKDQSARLTPTATRYIFLVRHGQYEDWQEEDKDRKLTPLGLEQAAVVGQWLKEFNFTFSKLVHSSMARARETSDIILKSLPSDIDVECSDLLREGNPIPSEPPIGTWREEFRYYEDGPRIEAAFRKYFHRADAKQKNDSYEIIVCHANVIRYFVCRLLQAPPEAWLRFALYHCSVTWAAITPNGHVHIYGIGDAGFMPKEKLTRV